MEKVIVFYCFKNSNQHGKQGGVAIKCDLETAHKLFDEEFIKIKNNDSKWDYFDITVNGKLLRSYPAL